MKHIIDTTSEDFIPAKGNLLVKPHEQQTEVTTASGIVTEIKRSMLDRPCYGKVVKSGSADYGVGLNVVYPNTDGIDCQLNDGDFMILKAESVIGGFADPHAH